MIQNSTIYSKPGSEDFMGVKYAILDELKKKQDGLSVKELSKTLDKSENTIRGTINRDLKPFGLVVFTKKREGSKVYKIPEDDKGNLKILDTDFLKEVIDLLEKNFKDTRFVMQFFESVKTKVQSKASEHEQEFVEVVDTLKETRAKIRDLKEKLEDESDTNE